MTIEIDGATRIITYDKPQALQHIVSIIPDLHHWVIRQKFCNQHKAIT